MADSAHTIGAPASPLALTDKGDLYALRKDLAACPQGVQPHLWRKALRQRVDTHLALATALLSVLDGIDPDPDLEPDLDAEASTWAENHFGRSAMFQGFNQPELSEDREDDGIDEPSLGAPESAMHQAGFYRSISFDAPFFVHVEPVDPQTSWARGRCDDDEDVNEDGGNILDEPHDAVDEDLEHSLGWGFGERSQFPAIMGMMNDRGDLEADYNAHGFGDGEAGEEPQTGELQGSAGLVEGQPCG